MSLIAAACERLGMPTATIVFLRAVAERVGPPRALHVPFPHGYPLGRPHDAVGQRHVLQALLDLFAEPGPGPLLRDYLALLSDSVP